MRAKGCVHSCGLPPHPLRSGEDVAGFSSVAPHDGSPKAMGRCGIFLAALLFSSCTTIKGNRNEGTFAYNSFLGNAKIGELGPEGMRNTEIDNATGGAVLERTAEKIGRAWAWGKAWDAAGKLIENGFDALEDGNETDVRINESNNATTIATQPPPPPEPLP